MKKWLLKKLLNFPNKKYSRKRFWSLWSKLAHRTWSACNKRKEKKELKLKLVASLASVSCLFRPGDGDCETSISEVFADCLGAHHSDSVGLKSSWVMFDMEAHRSPVMSGLFCCLDGCKLLGREALGSVHHVFVCLGESESLKQSSGSHWCSC